MVNVTVVMTTYAPEGSRREEYACRSAVSLLDNLTGADLRLHTADDGSFDFTYLQNIRKIANTKWRVSTASNSQRNGIGASLNKALDHVLIGDDLWMYTTDDWVLTRRLDLTKAIKLIDIGYDYVRLGPIHPHLACATQFNADIGWWLLLHQKFGGFAFATRPFLATRRFYTRVGLFKERCDSYVCERDYAERVSQIETLTLGAINLAGPWDNLAYDDPSIGAVDSWVTA